MRKVGHRHWDRACRLLRRYGTGAVFVARFLPVVRTLTPAAAGASGLRYRRFLPASLAGATAWSFLHVSIGWAAGASAKYVENVLGRTGWLLAAVLALAGVVLWLRRRHGAAEADESGQPAAELDPDEDVGRAA